MDMHDPSLVPGGETKDSTLNEAAATEAEAVTATPDPEAAVEVEEIMAEGEEDAELAAERQPLTDESLMAQALALLAKDASEITTDEIRRLRQLHSMLHKPAQAAEGEQPQAEEKGEFELVIERLRTKKSEWIAAQEAAKAANLERKNAIIDEINALAEDTDNVNRTFPRYRELQDEFNAIGDVDPMQETSVWKRFQEAREHYSDNLKINKELRDYDFKKNLEDKEALLAEAQSLVADEAVCKTFTINGVRSAL